MHDLMSAAEVEAVTAEVRTGMPYLRGGERNSMLDPARDKMKSSPDRFQAFWLEHGAVHVALPSESEVCRSTSQMFISYGVYKHLNCQNTEAAFAYHVDRTNAGGCSQV